jgi:hypothetical protein
VTAPQSPEDGGAIQYLQLNLDGKMAGGIADLKSLAGDIEYARWCGQTYLQWMGAHGPTGPEADNLRRALWTACCITYRRVFTNGKGHISPQQSRPQPNQNFKAALTHDHLAAHDSVLDTAYRHVAHRVNELELVQVSAVLNPPPLPRAVAGVSTLIAHYGGPIEPELVERFIAVCDVLLAGTNQEHERVTQQALTFLQQGDLDEMYAAAQQPDEQGQNPT